MRDLIYMQSYVESAIAIGKGMRRLRLVVRELEHAKDELSKLRLEQEHEMQRTTVVCFRPPGRQALVRFGHRISTINCSGRA